MCCCAHLIDPASSSHCARGVNYRSLAGGGVHYMVFRLPCVSITNRRGEDVRTCAQFAAATESEK
ncbi:hypothetical protein [Janthinobacterium sp. CG_S6]|uniref:hypothetical protein n=1 Tax=Janthinobacterium sp. CG_S6 TaxID=3071707 RepID=UPI002E085E09|nr:hypothetical protein [Janthinobacterium sp. CG_S6]